jgi:hypothetical protein
MPHRVLVAAAAWLMLASAYFPAVAADDGSAVAYINGLYLDKDYPGKDARYSQRLDELRAACEKRADQADDICIDFDFFTMAQDFELSAVKVEQKSGDPQKAKVEANFKNFGKDTTVTFDLIKDDKGWMIDEMTSGCETLSGVLQGKTASC